MKQPRPTPELLAALRSAKGELHDEQRDLPLQEKVRQLLQLQRIDFAIRAPRGELRWWERPWEIEP